MKNNFAMAAMVIVFTAVSGAEAGANTPPPPPAPPVVLSVPPVRTVQQADSGPVSTLDLVVTGGRETLWSGTVRVSNYGASYSQSLRDAQELCAGRSADAEIRNVDSQRQLSFSINRGYPRDDGNHFNVQVDWTRLVPPCEGSGTRSVRLNQRIDLVPGQALRLAGDGGLAVSLTLRKD